MKRIFYFLLTACTLSACDAQQEKPAPADLRSFIKDKTDSTFKKHDLPGIMVAVFNNNERMYYSDGFADPDNKVVFDSASVFEIGSITKTFTAFVLMHVLHDRQISDSSSIISYLPDSVRKNKELEKISFLSLMNHTSGLPRLPDNMADLNGKAPYDHYTAEDLYRYLHGCKPTPDGKSNYSNLGMGLAGVLAARISGKTYDSLLTEYIYDPFKMQVPNSMAKKAQGYFTDGKIGFWNMDVLAPAGAIQSSANEMLNYLQYMSQPTGSTDSVLIKKLLEPTVKLYPQLNICRAWHTLEETGKPVIYWHNGGTYGFSTFAAFIKGQSKAVVVATNKFNTNEASDGLGFMIMKELLK